MYKSPKTMTKFLTVLFLGILPICSLGETASATVLIKPSAPEITYGGRWEKSSDQLYRVGHGAAYLQATFTGDRIEAKINDKGQEIFWLARIDDGYLQRFKAQKDTTVLGNYLGKGTHKLFLVRDTEGGAGITDFTGLVLPSDGKLLPETTPPRYKLEFVGDSISAGAYALGREFEGGTSYMETESSYLAFGPLLARQLRAEYSVLGESGEGVVSNYQEPSHSSACHAADSYLRTFSSARLPLWQETGKEPDIVILNHGTNDYLSNRIPKAEDFTAGYRHLIEVVRSKHPQAVILCVSPIPIAEYQITNPLIAQAVQAEQAKGDTKVFYVPVNSEAPLLQKSDYAGDNEHPLAKGHKKIADFLFPIVYGILKNNK